MAIGAFLFDIDGTLIDSDPLHAGVFKELLGARGIAVDRAFYLANIHGRHNTEIFRELLPDEDAHALHLQKEAAFREILPARYPAMAGADAFVARARADGVILAAVTNAPRLNAEAMLRATGLSEAIPTIVVGEECVRGKPAPDPYLVALEKLGVPAERAVAFEDSPSGIASAVAAGLCTVGLRSSLSDAELLDLGCALSIADYHDPGLREILGDVTRAG